ncbi:MAG: tRNA (N6-threonylcarbamoyladenosine(37)-N6)-methyltransferase TrmO [Candidatus Lokiarchaeota archaeon]|nr:tRNA (N6-threonylcarbamoyladenosine(37)-N6)-methyltransferase TrmO [Candidatus Lokiarchaeota archaeon]
MKTISFKPIGIVHSPLKSLKGIPIQFSMSEVEGKLEIFEEFVPGLKDLDGFSHIYCLYFFDLVKLPVALQSKPFLDNQVRGVFSMRTPFRPNPIGLSILEVEKIEGKFVFVKHLDILDKTPILDIKPYINDFDTIRSYKQGWTAGKVKKKSS